MLHTNNDKVRSLLLKGNFGLEKESLRITRDGNFALSLHPFPDNPNIVYDFCENQTEINTDVAPSAEEAQKLLAFHTRQIHRKLVSLDEPEYMWPFSNPPFIPNERDIPIAHHNIKAEYSEGYREYLANRYGRYMMSLSGIHVNFSFADELLKADFGLSESDNFEEYKNSVYLGLAAGLAAYGWIVTALTAASPLLDGSFLERGKRGITAFNGLASTRCSELGYWNHFVPVFDYSDIKAYAASIQQYVDAGLLDSDFQPKNLSWSQSALLAKDASERLHIDDVWQQFGQLWEIDPQILRSYFNRAMNQKKTLQFLDTLKKIHESHI